jgi:hydrogenase nickel incorporation protein HypA/HybF
MHEASIALSIIDIADKECRKAGCSRVTSIEVDIGSASGVLTDALYSAFDIVKHDTPAAGAKLIINEIPLGGTCRDCGRPFTTTEPFILACPNCGGKDFRFETGRELNVKEIEVE